MLMQSIADPAGILQHPQFQAQTPFFARRLRLARLGINADARWECLRVSSSWVLSLACFAQMVAQHGRSTRASSSPAPASTLMYSRGPGQRAAARSAHMEPPCPHCDQPDPTLLRLVLIGELLCADETPLLRLAAVLQACGLLQPSPPPDAPESPLVQARKATLHYLQQP